MRYVIRIFVFSILFDILLLSAQVKFMGKINLSQKGEIFLVFPTSFFVTEDNLIFTTDFKVGNLKIFSIKGDLIQEFGRRGPGPNEFSTPMYLGYHKSIFAILDSGNRRVFVYKIKQQAPLQFEKIKQFVCERSGDQVCVLDDAIMISGTKEDDSGNSYTLYTRNLSVDIVTYLVPSQIKYGLDSYSTKAYLNEFRNNSKYATLGTHGYCDWVDEHVYFLWEGNLRIIDVNMKTKKIAIFGNKTKSYTPPEPSSKMKKAYEIGNTEIHQIERKKLTYINMLFADRGFLGIAYTQPIKDNSAYNLIYQFYTLDGKLIREVNGGEVRYPPIFYFKKEENKLFLLGYEEDKDYNMTFFISIYKIEI